MLTDEQIKDIKDRAYSQHFFAPVDWAIREALRLANIALARELNTLKWMGADEGWDKAIEAVRAHMLAEQNAGEQDKGRPADFQSADRGVQLSSPAPSAAPDKRVCHAPGDKCYGCAHYHGKAAVCEYAPAAPDMPPEPVLHNSVYGPANDVWVKAEDFILWSAYAIAQRDRADAAQRDAARYECVRRMSARDFVDLYNRCIKQYLKFDDEIDRAMAGEGKEWDN